MTDGEKTALLATRLMGWQSGLFGVTPVWAKQSGEVIFDLVKYTEDEIKQEAEFIFRDLMREHNTWVWQPYERIEHAWMVVKALIAAGWIIDLECNSDGIRVQTHKDTEWGVGYAGIPDAGRAICEAAGQALGLWEEGE